MRGGGRAEAGSSEINTRLIEERLDVWGGDPESIFVASACEYGVAVQGDGYSFRVSS